MFTINRPRKLESDELGGFGAALRNAMGVYGDMQTLKKQTTENQFLPQEKEQGLKKLIADALIRQEEARVAPQMQNALLQTEKMQAPNLRSQISNRDQETNRSRQMTPYDVILKKLESQYYGRDKESQIKERDALADYRKSGGASQGVRGKEELLYASGVAQDNPHLTTQEQIREAGNSYATGASTLQDGTPLQPMSPATKRSLDALVKGTTTATLLTQTGQANQAEAEMQVISKFAQEGLKPYGTTYFNMSPEQIADSFKSDSASQKRLGRFIAAQQLQNEIAQEETKLAQGQPGITNTLELMSLGQQLISAKYPRLSAEARLESQNYFMDALKKGFEARKKVGLSASDIARKPQEEKGSEKTSEVVRVSSPDGSEQLEGTEEQISSFLKEHKTWKRSK